MCQVLSSTDPAGWPPARTRTACWRTAKRQELRKTFWDRGRGIGVWHGQTHYSVSATASKPGPDGPMEWAIFQIGDSRVVIDLRGPVPKLREDLAEVISIEGNRKRSRKNTQITPP